jgi:hypothetical protein
MGPMYQRQRGSLPGRAIDSHLNNIGDDEGMTKEFEELARYDEPLQDSGPDDQTVIESIALGLQDILLRVEELQEKMGEQLEFLKRFCGMDKVQDELGQCQTSLKAALRSIKKLQEVNDGLT